MWFADGSQTVAPEKVMMEHWLYTQFDNLWRPGDAKENQLADLEKLAAKLFRTATKANHVPTTGEWVSLCDWLALTACRHPRALARATALARKFAFDLADAHSKTDVQFIEGLRASYGLSDELEGFHEILTASNEEDLLEQADEIQGMSPQDPRLPALMAIEAFPRVSQAIQAMDLILLDAPAGSEFILGDMPVPLEKLGANGFATPLSKHVAIVALPRRSPTHLVRDRRHTSVTIVNQINAAQFAHTRTGIVGSSKTLVERVANQS